MPEEVSFEDASTPHQEVSFEEASQPREVSFEEATAPQLSATKPESLGARALHALRDNPVATAILGPSERTRLAEGVPNPDTGRLEVKPLGSKVESRGLIPGVAEGLSTPIKEIPRVESAPDEGWAPASLHAAENTGIGIANALQSPAGVATIPFPAARVAMWVYMAGQVPSQTQEAYEAFKSGRKEEGIEKAVQAMLGVGGGLGARKEAAPAARDVLPREVVERPDSKQIADRMVAQQETLKADDAAREALRPENAQVKADEAPADVAQRRANDSVGRLALDNAPRWTDADQLYAEQKYGVGPERQVKEVPGGILAEPEFINKTDAAFRNESEDVARTTKEAGPEQPVESKPVTPLPTDELAKADELTPSTKLKTAAEAARERVKATLEADSAIRDAAGCL